MRSGQWHYVLGWLVVVVGHNWPVILALLGTTFSAIYVWRSPSRRRVASLYGFALLAMAYEYNKHVRPRLQDAANYLLMSELLPLNRPVWVLVGPVMTRALVAAAIASLTYAAIGGRLARL